MVFALPPDEARADGTRAAALAMQGGSPWVAGTWVPSGTAAPQPFVVRLGQSDGAIDAGGLLEDDSQDGAVAIGAGPLDRLFGVAAASDAQERDPYLFALDQQGRLIPGCEHAMIGTEIGRPLAVRGTADDKVWVVGATDDFRIAVRVFEPDCTPIGDIDFFRFRSSPAGPERDSTPLGAFAHGGAITVFGGAWVPLAGGGQEQQAAMTQLMLDQDVPSETWAKLYPGGLLNLTAADPVTVAGNPDRILGAGSRSAAGPGIAFFDFADGTQVGSVGDAPGGFQSFAAQQDAGRVILGGEAFASGPQGPEIVLGASAVRATPPPATDSTFGSSGIWVFDPFPGPFVVVRGLGTGAGWIWEAWSGDDAGTDRTGVTRLPGSGQTGTEVTTPLDGSTFQTIQVAPPDVNDPPVISLPPPQTVAAGQTLTIAPPISVSDPDAGSGMVEVKLLAGAGTVSVGTVTGVETATLRGTLAEVNASLAGLRYTPRPGFTGQAEISVFADDLGNTGPGGPKTDFRTLPITVTSPAGGGPQGGRLADLVTSLRIDREAEVKLRRKGPKEDLFIRVTVANRGPNAADDVTVRNEMVTTVPGGVTALPQPRASEPRVCRFKSPVLDCATVLSGQQSQSGIEYWSPFIGTGVVTATASSTTPDPDPTNNVATLEVEIEHVPDSKDLRFHTRGGIVVSRAGAAHTVTGKATDARVVYVALARRPQGGQARSSAAGCAWLRNARGVLRQERGRSCDEPVWLKARGRRSFRFDIARALPPGAYTVLSRAVARSGVTEATFAPKDGNRAELHIRRRGR